MKDIIWTFIIVWLIYKIVDLFKSAGTKKNFVNNPRENNPSVHNPSRAEKDIKNAVKKHLNNEGEYVDFEEVK